MLLLTGLVEPTGWPDLLHQRREDGNSVLRICPCHTPSSILYNRSWPSKLGFEQRANQLVGAKWWIVTSIMWATVVIVKMFVIVWGAQFWQIKTPKTLQHVWIHSPKISLFTCSWRFVPAMTLCHSLPTTRIQWVMPVTLGPVGTRHWGLAD